MNFDHLHYVPCLRWKQGEYEAIFRLPNQTKSSFTPLIEVPEIGYDFETRKAAKRIDDHLKDFGKRVQTKWGNRICFVDLALVGPSERMATGVHPVSYVFNDLRNWRCSAVPVTGLGRDDAYQQAITDVVSEDDAGACFRITLREASQGDLKANLDDLSTKLRVRHDNCDLILDLDAPNFEPLQAFERVVRGIVLKLPYLDEWRTLTVIGTSFPRTMADLRTGSQVVPRYEWQLYRMLINGLRPTKRRLPTFGDYGISHPEVLKVDMRLVKTKASIRYTIDDEWYIIKGTSVRDDGFGQYRRHCQTLTSSRHYEGPEFSWGDGYISGCAQGTKKTGNLTTWRRVGTNHHIERVTRDIASFYGS